MARPRRHLVDEILKVRAAIIQAVSAATAPAWMHLELTMSQMKGLRTLAYHGPATVSLIAETLRIGLPTASQLVDRLVQAGLAERAEDPSDRRRILVRLSKKGQQLHDGLNQGPQAFRIWLHRMNGDDLEALRRGYVALARIALAGTNGGVPMEEPVRRGAHVRSQ
ncbi:MAG: MarR family transcriptional regulator [Bacillati bacterium ANGP1]|uniref:MarR family transcriptional regulator n=1 Tax=Candidatus Segetimicrobium genomatis TaxID=2569760 RepID=A0A537LI16_9BACT|nr:MAG: MarR family transcriptional regulator [Terrabacteria group bacterium ANGP1]